MEQKIVDAMRNSIFGSPSSEIIDDTPFVTAEPEKR